MALGRRLPVVAGDGNGDPSPHSCRFPGFAYVTVQGTLEGESTLPPQNAKASDETAVTRAMPTGVYLHGWKGASPAGLASGRDARETYL